MKCTQNKLIILPKKHRIAILDFAKEYEKLAAPRTISIKLNVSLTTNIAWRSDTTIDIDDHDKINSLIEKSNTIKIINDKIKEFCERTERWGEIHFDNTMWLWDNVLWKFNPEMGEKFVDHKIKWE